MLGKETTRTLKLGNSWHFETIAKSWESGKCKFMSRSLMWHIIIKQTFLEIWSHSYITYFTFASMETLVWKENSKEYTKWGREQICQNNCWAFQENKVANTEYKMWPRFPRPTWFLVTGEEWRGFIFQLLQCGWFTALVRHSPLLSFNTSTRWRKISPLPTHWVKVWLELFTTSSTLLSVWCKIQIFLYLVTHNIFLFIFIGFLFSAQIVVPLCQYV